MSGTERVATTNEEGRESVSSQGTGIGFRRGQSIAKQSGFSPTDTILNSARNSGVQSSGESPLNDMQWSVLVTEESLLPAVPPLGHVVRQTRATTCANLAIMARSILHWDGLVKK